MLQWPQQAYIQVQTTLAYHFSNAKNCTNTYINIIIVSTVSDRNFAPRWAYGLGYPAINGLMSFQHMIGQIHVVPMCSKLMIYNVINQFVM